jgi:hypothetical protein
MKISGESVNLYNVKPILLHTSLLYFHICQDSIIMDSADNPPGAGKLSSLLVQVLTRVLFGPPIPQVAAMEQKCIARSKIFM